MADGDSLDLGRVRLTVLETPGHTVESISILVFDLDATRVQPQAILTGDTLFVGDVGRPDLRASLGWSANDLGKMLYHSVREKLLPLPDATLVYPAHGAGSLCGKSLSKETVSTIGEQRRTNYALQPMSESRLHRARHRGSARCAVVFHLRRGAQYQGAADARRRCWSTSSSRSTSTCCCRCSRWARKSWTCATPVEYARAHLKGSLNIGLGGSYATWAGTILDRDKPIVIIAEPGRQEEAAMRLGRIGFDSIVGYLRDGISALEARTDLMTGTDARDSGRSGRRARLVGAACLFSTSGRRKSGRSRTSTAASTSR